MPDGESPARILGRALLLEQPYVALGILGLYAVLLPLMPAILSTARRAWWGVLLVSCALYLAVQPGLIGPWGFPDVFRAWQFHPAAWQLLFVAGILCGFRGRTHGFAVPKRGWVTAVAMAVLLYALLAEKRSWLVATFGWPAMEDWEWLNRLSGWPRTKPTLGPARLLHFGALACVVASFCPGEGARVWRSAIVRPLVNSGRHSLTLYCLGTVLVYLALLPFEYIGTAPEAVLLLGIDACVLQFLAAGGLERRRRNGPVAVSSPAHR